MGIIIDGIRRFNPSISSKEESPTSYDKLLSRTKKESLSSVLPDVIQFAKLNGEAELERWCRMELFGYNEQGGMSEADVVPEYRGVNGRWINEYDQILDLSEHDDLAIVNHFRFRFGAKMLEELSQRKKMQNIADDESKQLLQQYMEFNAVRFCFSPVEVLGILDTIKNLLVEKINDIKIRK